MEQNAIQFNYISYIHALAIIEFIPIIATLYAAKRNKQYTLGHLFAGLFLIFIGILAYVFFDNTLNMIRQWTEKSWINSQGGVQAISWLQTLHYIIPLISLSFGVRFVGNWIVAEKPDKYIQDKKYSGKS
ncbi:MAG: hypothetical protein ACYC0M_03205 [Burkholderiales bacterium]